ncbi:MAG TPA: hypothetical protein VF278_25210, partial [Pirellulales bacterium]
MSDSSIIGKPSKIFSATSRRTFRRLADAGNQIGGTRHRRKINIQIWLWAIRHCSPGEREAEKANNLLALPRRIAITVESWRPDLRYRRKLAKRGAGFDEPLARSTSIL